MAKVLVFDSGVGGLSIAKGIIDSVPNIQLVFASDNEAYPYGTKTEESLIPRVLLVVEKLIDHVSADILVVACNTASTVVLPTLREQLNVPVVGVVPAIKPAVKVSNNGKIGVLATPATVKRQYTQDLIDSFANDCNVSLLGSSELVDIAEQKLHQGKVDEIQLESVLKPWLSSDNQIDTIVLACTHFPLLKEELNSVFLKLNRAITWVDSTIGIAKRVNFLIQQNSFSTAHKKLDNQAIFTQQVAHSECFVGNLQQLQINTLDILSVD